MDWIKLEIKKPNIGQTVFSWGKQGMRICIYTNEIGLFGKKKENAKFCNLMSKWRFIDEDVTHWMPLPTPPKILQPTASGKVVTNGCKLSVQNIKEPVDVYEKEDGNLYFKPYGKEELVNSYFSNDLILID